MSAWTEGSAPSLTVTAAVVWGTWRTQNPHCIPEAATIFCTSEVTSMKASRLFDLTVQLCILVGPGEETRRALPAQSF